MMRRLQVLTLLRNNCDPMPAVEISDCLNIENGTFGKIFRELLDEKLIDRFESKSKRVSYQITLAGHDWLEQPVWIGNREPGSGRPKDHELFSNGMNIGIFSTGEIQINVGGKRITLSREHSSHLVEFLDTMPRDIFKTSKRGMGVSQSGIHRMADSD